MIAIMMTWHLFRTSMFFSVPLRCLPPHEFWVDSAGNRWPLFASFSLVFVLLLAWVVCLIVDSARSRLLDQALLTVCGASLLGIGFGLWSVLDEMTVVYHQELGSYVEWNRTENKPWMVGDCDRAKPFLGEWRVVAVETPFLGQEFPYDIVEFRRDLTLSSSRGQSQQPHEGRWGPPNGWMGYGWIHTDEIDGAWNFQLDETKLTLSTPVEWEEPISIVVLERL
jgi:hypothetical protein